MAVYADILILVNIIADYFLLLLACQFLHTHPRLWRMIVSAVVGGLFSLCIFLPQTNFLLESGIHILTCATMCLIAFGFENAKTFLRSVAVLFLVNFAYSGAMIAVWFLFEPYGMVINNSIIYFDISPLFLVLFSVIGYFVAMLLKKILKKPFLQNTYCDIELFCCDKKIITNGIADTGNSLKDVFGISQILITDKDTADMILCDQKQNPARFRKIPCDTIAGEKLLDGYRIDRAKIKFNNKEFRFENPILAVSTTPLRDAKIIVNPENLN